MSIDPAVLQAALRDLVGYLDYDLMKSIDDPEDDGGDDWSDYTALFQRYIEKHEENRG